MLFENNHTFVLPGTRALMMFGMSDYTHEMEKVLGFDTVYYITSAKKSCKYIRPDNN